MLRICSCMGDKHRSHLRLETLGYLLHPKVYWSGGFSSEIRGRGGVDNPRQQLWARSIVTLSVQEFQYGADMYLANDHCSMQSQHLALRILKCGFILSLWPEVLTLPHWKLGSDSMKGDVSDHVTATVLFGNCHHVSRSRPRALYPRAPSSLGRKTAR